MLVEDRALVCNSETQGLYVLARGRVQRVDVAGAGLERDLQLIEEQGNGEQGFEHPCVGHAGIGSFPGGHETLQVPFIVDGHVVVTDLFGLQSGILTVTRMRREHSRHNDSKGNSC